MTAQAITVPNNATWRGATFALLDGGTPIPINSDTTITMHVRETAEATTLALEISRANGRLIVVDANAATVRIEVPASVMKDVPAGSYVFDIRVVQGSGRVLRPVTGTLEVEQGVTR